jgi:hypothetical protein
MTLPDGLRVINNSDLTFTAEATFIRRNGCITGVNIFIRNTEEK